MTASTSALVILTVTEVWRKLLQSRVSRTGQGACSGVTRLQRDTAPFTVVLEASLGEKQFRLEQGSSTLVLLTFAADSPLLRGLPHTL